MKAKIFCLIIFTILISVIFLSCDKVGGPMGPDPPNQPDNSKYCDLQVEYIRTEILNPDKVNAPPSLLLFSPEGGHVTGVPVKVDDYHFKCDFPHVKAGLGGYYYFHNKDLARYDLINDSSVMVGDIYKVTVKQTGTITELKDVRPYNLSTNPYPGPYAKAAFFRLNIEGVIISSPQ